MPAVQTVISQAAKLRGVSGALELPQRELTPFFQTHLIFNILVRDTCEQIIKMKAGNFSNNPQDAELLRSFAEVCLKLPANQANHLLTRLFCRYNEYTSNINSINALKDITENKIIKTRKNFSKTIWKEVFNNLPKAQELSKLGMSPDPLKEYKKLSTEVKKKLNLEGLLKLYDLIDNNPDINQKINLRKIIFDNYEKAYKAGLARYQEECKPLKELLGHCDQALEVLNKVQTGWYPLGNFYSAQRSLQGSPHIWRVSDLNLLWHRQFLQQAIEHLKSYFELKEMAQENLAEWQAAKALLAEQPEVKAYLEARPRLLEVLAEQNERYLKPSEMLELLDLAPEVFPSWSKAKDSDFGKGNLRKEAKLYIEIQTEDGQKRFKNNWRRALFSAFPEIKQLFNIHNLYQRSFAEKPSEPSLTLPDPYQHPRWVIWSAAQRGALDIKQSSSGKNAKTKLSVELPLLELNSSGLAVKETCLELSGNPCLKEIRPVKRQNDTILIKKDRISAEETEVKIGAIRMEFSNLNEKALVSGLESDCIFKFTIKRDRTPTTEWVKDYHSKKDPLTKEPILPKKIIVCSFVHDQENFGEFLAAEVLTPYNNARTLKLLKIPDLDLDSVTLPTKIARHRQLAEKFGRRINKLASQLLNLGPEETDKYDLLNKELKRKTKVRAKLWQHISNATNNRAKHIAGAIVRRLEEIRKNYPEHEVALVIEYRKEFKAKASWSKDFNRLVMSSTAGAVIDTVKQSCQDRPRPIPVFGLSLYSLDQIVPSSKKPQVYHYKINTKDGRHTVELINKSRQVALVTEDSKGQAHLKLVDNSLAIVASNLIRKFVSPSQYAGLDHDEIERVQKEHWEKANLADAILELHYSK